MIFFQNLVNGMWTNVLAKDLFLRDIYSYKTCFKLASTTSQIRKLVKNSGEKGTLLLFSHVDVWAQIFIELFCFCLKEKQLFPPHFYTKAK